MPSIQAYHFDLYRLADPEELEFIGIRDYFGPGTVNLIEWPNRGAGFIPPADVSVHFQINGPSREVFIHRESEQGREILKGLG